MPFVIISIHQNHLTLSTTLLSLPPFRFGERQPAVALHCSMTLQQPHESARYVWTSSVSPWSLLAASRAPISNVYTFILAYSHHESCHPTCHPCMKMHAHKSNDPYQAIHVVSSDTQTILSDTQTVLEAHRLLYDYLTAHPSASIDIRSCKRA